MDRTDVTEGYVSFTFLSHSPLQKYTPKGIIETVREKIMNVNPE